jgi:hypothetical protein
MGLVQGLACSRHDGEETLLLSLRGSRGGLSHGRRVILLPLHSGGNLLLLGREVGGDAHRDQEDAGGWGGGGWQQTLGLGQR